MSANLDFHAARQRHSLAEVASRYTNVVRKGSEYAGLCCFHKDSDPSMTIFRGRDGVERYRCFACGAYGDVIDFVAEVESVDKAEALRRLDGEQLPQPDMSRTLESLPPDESDCWDPIVPVPEDAPAYDPARTFNPKRGRHVRYNPTLTTPYAHADGRRIGYVVRLEFDDGKKICPVITFCIGPGGKREWCAKRPPAPYPLVGAERLAQAPGASVIVVEGEKKRDALQAVLERSVVVSLLGGAEGVDKNDLTPLVGRSVTLWPDADPVGRRAMRKVGAAISGAQA